MIVQTTYKKKTLKKKKKKKLGKSIIIIGKEVKKISNDFKQYDSANLI